MKLKLYIIFLISSFFLTAQDSSSVEGEVPAPLSKIANFEKKLPKSYITKDGFNVTKKAIEYLKPLIIGEAFPDFKNGVPKINKLKLTVESSDKRRIKMVKANRLNSNE